MDLSIFLSRTVGIYLVIVSVLLLTKTSQFYGIIASMAGDAPLMFVSGLFTLMIGIAMVVSHHIWVMNWRVSVTIISWIILLKAICILFCPLSMNALTLNFIRSTTYAYAAGSFDLALGLVFIYFGFRPYKN